MRIRLGTTVILALLLAAIAVPVSAHTGAITSGGDCESGWVKVSLNHDTTADRTVTVTTSIPGTTGISNGHYDTTFGQIWSASGPQPFAGIVTLTIDAGTNQEFTVSKTVYGKEPCQEPTPTPTSTPTQTPEPTPTATSTPTATPTSTEPLTPTATPSTTHDPTPTPKQPVTTLPPTSTAGGPADPSEPFDATTAAALFLALVCIVLLLPNVKRPAR